MQTTARKPLPENPLPWPFLNIRVESIQVEKKTRTKLEADVTTQM
jgi:hypothetical protein